MGISVGNLVHLSLAMALGAPVLTFAADAAEPANATDPTVLRSVSVVEDAETYVPATATAGAKGNLAIRDIPQSVTVFNESVIRDIAPRKLDELADYVAGVEREGAQASPYSLSFYFRGFGTGGSGSSYNGYRETGFNTPQAGINIERIEFLKGPASVLSGGNGALSGLVNIVSKRPQAESFNRLEVAAGSFDHLLASLDSTGSLNDAGSLRYRLTTSIDKDGSFVNGARQQSVFVSPYLSWDINDDTTLDIELLNQDIDRPGREAYFQRHPDFFLIPVDTQLGDPGVPLGSGGDLKRRLARLDLRHRLANGWQFRQGLFIHEVHNDDSTIQAAGYDPVTHLAPRFLRTINDDYQRERTSQTELSGESMTGSLRHQWLAGIELSLQNSGYQIGFSPYTPVDIFNPHSPGALLGPREAPSPPFDGRNRTQAVYLQDLISIGAGFKVLAGLRYDRLDLLSQTQGSAEVRQSEREVSPRVGLLYESDDRTTWYMSFGRSFRPNSGRSAQGNLFDPQQGNLKELGVKRDFDSGLAVTASAFEYTYENVLTTDPDNVNFSIAVGEQRSRGVELEALGRLTRDWSIVASYGYVDAKVTKDNRFPVGDHRTGIPEHSVGLFNRVDLLALGLPQWSVTAGAVYASDRPSGIPNDPAGPITAAQVTLPSYTRLDAGIIYHGDRYEARLNGRNLTDERIYDGYNSTFEPRAPRSYELSVAVEF
jgi:iron complex outermembrane recepter protein